MLHTKYQDSRPSGFRQEDFFMFSYLAYVNYVTPGAGQFLAQETNLDKLGSGPLGNATYQISRL